MGVLIFSKFKMSQAIQFTACVSKYHQDVKVTEEKDR